MKWQFKKKNFFNQEGGLQDSVFLVGIMLLLSILIIGLLPGPGAQTLVSEEFFIYSVMIIPVITAIYFIVTSFRRNLYSETGSIGSSITKKMVMAFVFIAVLPTLPIVIASNYMLQQTMSHLSFDKTTRALQEARKISAEPIQGLHDVVGNESDTLRFLYKSNILNPLTDSGRQAVRDYALHRNFMTEFFQVLPGDELLHLPLKQGDSPLAGRFRDLYRSLGPSGHEGVYRISAGSQSYFVSAIRKQDLLTVLYRQISPEIARRMQLFETSLKDFRKVEFLGEYFKSNTSFFLFSLSIFVIMMSVVVSLFLSRTITRPVLELSEAANEIASGNFMISLQHDSKDELGLLYKSFNHMIQDLDRNRKIMYQKQRLEAWKEMARKVVHEIKNPLTPIRLSAERMRKRSIEGDPDLGGIILTGTETIIEEVDSLMRLLSEFTNFARLPEMKPARENIASVIESSAELFAGHEKVRISLHISDGMPPVFIDKSLLRRALGNLIQNAIDAMNNQGMIDIKAEYVDNVQPSVVKITISDNGPGIKPTDIDRVFEPGFSLKPSGSGLGLAIVEKIILEHQGRIYCSSEYGKGSEFIVELPVNHEGVLIDGKDTDRR
ncbi:MAG TPA: ATP-binding protein [Spirochaetota bacterium]|nr:ATP-binding protein [Spirochaetota bacterium]HSA14708.1 ATP-binding protein [Spirochaetota bacterium]